MRTRHERRHGSSWWGVGLVAGLLMSMLSGLGHGSEEFAPPIGEQVVFSLNLDDLPTDLQNMASTYWFYLRCGEGRYVDVAPGERVPWENPPRMAGVGA
jgi:hypothetical protein